MLSPEEIRRFAVSYFEAVGAAVLEQSPAHIRVLVPAEVDKELTDRPFYWMWVEATGQTVEPAPMTFVFDPDAFESGDEAAEWLAPGSFRLQKMFDSACRRGSCVRMYERESGPGALIPVLLVYYTASYIADNRMDRMAAVGIDLTDGRIFHDPEGRCPDLPLSEKPPAGRSVVEPRLDWQTAWNLFCAAVRLQLSHDDHTWARQAWERRRREEENLERYYRQLLSERGEQKDLLEGEWHVRRQELQWRHGPRIEVTPVQWAWLSLSPQTLERLFGRAGEERCRPPLTNPHPPASESSKFGSGPSHSMCRSRASSPSRKPWRFI